jgi:hypothetical protein
MAASDPRGQEEDGIKRFDPRILDRSVIAIPLLEAISKDENQAHAVIIDMNLDYDEGREAGRKWIREADQKRHSHNRTVRRKARRTREEVGLEQSIHLRPSQWKSNSRTRPAGREHAGSQAKTAKKPRQPKKRGKASVQSSAAALYRFRAIYRIWPDFKISPCITKSLATVKADAAQTSFCAHGVDITWAIMDSASTRIIRTLCDTGTLIPTSPLHADFTDTPNVPKGG